MTRVLGDHNQLLEWAEASDYTQRWNHRETAEQKTITKAQNKNKASASRKAKSGAASDGERDENKVTEATWAAEQIN